MMVAVLEKKASSAGTLAAVDKTYDVYLEDTVLSDAAWENVDDTIMDLVAEEE